MDGIPRLCPYVSIVAGAMFYGQWVSTYGGIYIVQKDKIGGSGCPDTQDTHDGAGPECIYVYMYACMYAWIEYSLLYYVWWWLRV